MYGAKNICPMIPSFDIRKTVSFFTDLLDFKIAREDKTYVILYKDNSMVHVLRAGQDIGEMEFYFEVDSVDEVWNKIKDKLEGIKYKSPFNQEYGMREIHIILPQTKTLMFIGQVIR